MKITDLVALAAVEGSQKEVSGGAARVGFGCGFHDLLQAQKCPKGASDAGSLPYREWLAHTYSPHGKRWRQLAGGPTPSNYFSSSALPQ